MRNEKWRRKTSWALETSPARQIARQRPEEAVRAAILAFAEKYGLLGFMTALPTTPKFMDYEAVYLPKNRFIQEESMQTEDYLRLFYPFERLNLVKRGKESLWNVKGDMEMVALTCAMSDVQAYVASLIMHPVWSHGRRLPCLRCCRSLVARPHGGVLAPPSLARPSGRFPVPLDIQFSRFRRSCRLPGAIPFHSIAEKTGGCIPFL